MGSSTSTADHKRCFKCMEVLPLSSFYCHPMMKDGHLGKCKECAKRDAREHRSNHPERARKWDREKWRRYRSEDRYADQREARRLVRDALKRGDLVKPALCSRCQQGGRIEGHHEDYSRPLDVEWVCVPCHRAIHTAGAF